MAGGRWRPTAMVANRKIVACNEIATSGTTDQRQSRVRHHRMTTTSRQTPMTLSVLPKREHTQLIGSQKSVRLRLNASVTPSSAWSTAMSGPVSSSPIPVRTRKRTTPGATARVRRSRPSCQ